MPKQLEQKLKRKARDMKLDEKRTGAFVYGTMRKAGWQPKREKRGK